ncbi:MAG: DegT/DnrJ/EryC1/StrS family aminotransferase [Devosia sp.]|nr:DegT/DnrJ/EryC1/StrS family aminotransferase [Devosia sp.]
MSARLSDRPWLAGSALAGIWQRGAGMTMLLSQASHAYSVILAVLAARDRPRPEIWVPAYFCEGALLVARRAGARLRFVPVTEAMTPVWPEVEAMTADSVPDLLVLPHFFGAESDGALARAFCDRIGCLLHEDAAHLLQPVGTVGTWGDFVSFSPRKYCGIADGGVLVVRGAKLAAEAEQAATRLAAVPQDTRRERFLLWRNGLPWMARRGPQPAVAFDVDPYGASSLPSVWISAPSSRRLHRLGPTGLDRIAAREAVTAAAIERALRPLGLEPLPRLAGATPYILGFRAPSQATAARAHDALRRAGAIAGSWPRLPPEVLAAPQHFGAAEALRQSVVRISTRYEERRRPLDFVAALEAAAS